MEAVLIKFMKWMDHVNKTDPMRLETDSTDIIMTFLEENPQFKSSHKIKCEFCGKEEGDVLVKHYHAECHEKILDGACII